MKNFKLKLASVLLLSFAFMAIGCNDDKPISKPDSPTVPTDPTDPTESKLDYFVAVEVGKDPSVDILVPSETIKEGEITTVNNGYQQPGWMFYFSLGKKIFTSDYNANKKITSHELNAEGKLVEKGSFVTDLQVFSSAKVDDKTLVLIGSAFEGFGQKELYVVDVESMQITKKAKIDLEVDKDADVSSTPSDIIVRGDKLFVSFHNVKGSNPRETPLPHANTAKLAVFNYPSLTFDKIIKDTRCPNLGRYSSGNVLEQAENGDIYTFAASSLACGFYPVPPLNSGVLRIKNGETEFDKDFHIDFEAISGGYKINDLFYVANGKAVVRVLKEDETNSDYAWGAYSPTAEIAIVETGILDLENKTFTLLPEVAKSGGSFASPVLVDGTKVYLGVSAKSYADIYEIDVTTNTAKKGASVQGNYAKAILKIK